MSSMTDFALYSKLRTYESPNISFAMVDLPVPDPPHYNAYIPMLWEFNIADKVFIGMFEFNIEVGLNFGRSESVFNVAFLYNVEMWHS